MDTKDWLNQNVDQINRDDEDDIDNVQNLLEFTSLERTPTEAQFLSAEEQQVYGAAKEALEKARELRKQAAAREAQAKQAHT